MTRRANTCPTACTVLPPSPARWNLPETVSTHPHQKHSPRNPSPLAFCSLVAVANTFLRSLLRYASSGGGSTAGCRTRPFFSTRRTEATASSPPTRARAWAGTPCLSSSIAMARWEGVICWWEDSRARSRAAFTISATLDVILLGSMPYVCVRCDRQ